MRRTLVTLLALAVAALTAGCAMQDLNPFSSRPLNPNEVVYSQFSDVPVPKDMTAVAKRSFINYAQDGTKNGLETLEGGFALVPLTRAMISNMTRDNWVLRATSSGAGRYMQLYERENRYAIIYYYDQTASVAMEVWVVSRLAEGAYQIPADPMPATPGYSAPSSTPGYSPSSSGSSGSSSGGVQERNLP